VIVVEPGLDLHEWATEWAGLEPLVEDSPAEALSELGDLIERILVARGYQLDEEVTLEGEEREIVDEYREARRISDLVERGESVDPGDIGLAITGFRNLYEYLIRERRAP
jgi:hypothetical protein